jgi:hypothetical protein
MNGGAQVRLDLNNLEFQQQLFELGKDDQRRVLLTLRKLARMTWDQVYRDTGLKWEAILTRTGPRDQRLYSLRMGQALRAVAFREESLLKLLSLHPDHDSAYD